MARSPANSDGSSEAEATTLIFPKKTAWEELVDAQRKAKTRASSANGTFSKVKSRLVEEEHMDRTAAGIVIKLDSLDDEDLHVTLFHLFDGIKKLSLLKRAMAQEDLFENLFESLSATVKDAKASSGRGRKKTEPPVDDSKVTRIGDHARNVSEQAGNA